MFSGIVEETGKILEIRKEQNNIHLFQNVLLSMN